MKSRFKIFVNGIELLFTIEGTKRAAQAHIKRYLVATHMGQWVKTADGYEYNTTIGKNYEFIRVRGPNHAIF